MKWKHICFVLIIFWTWEGVVPKMAFSNLICRMLQFELTPLQGMGYYTVPGQIVNENGRANFGRLVLVLGFKNFALDWAFEQVSFGAPRVGVNDMSMKGCVQFGSHKSRAHREGRAMDLRLMSTLGERGTNTGSKDYDRGRTILMINNLIASIGNYNIAKVCLKDLGLTYKIDLETNNEVDTPVDLAGVKVTPCDGNVHIDHVHIELKEP